MGDLACGRCGYNLRARPSEEPCSECGAPVSVARPLCFERPWRLRMTLIGLWLVVAGVLATEFADVQIVRLLGAPVDAWFIQTYGQHPHTTEGRAPQTVNVAWSLAAVIESSIVFVGLLAYTTRSPIVALRSAGSWRRITRTAAFVIPVYSARQLVSAMESHAWELPIRGHAELMTLASIQVVLEVGAVVYASQLLRSVPAPRRRWFVLALVLPIAANVLAIASLEAVQVYRRAAFPDVFRRPYALPWKDGFVCYLPSGDILHASTPPDEWVAQHERIKTIHQSAEYRQCTRWIVLLTKSQSYTRLPRLAASLLIATILLVALHRALRDSQAARRLGVT